MIYLRLTHKKLQLQLSEFISCHSEGSVWALKIVLILSTGLLCSVFFHILFHFTGITKGVSLGYQLLGFWLIFLTFSIIAGMGKRFDNDFCFRFIKKLGLQPGQRPDIRLALYNLQVAYEKNKIEQIIKPPKPYSQTTVDVPRNSGLSQNKRKSYQHKI